MIKLVFLVLILLTSGCNINPQQSRMISGAIVGGTFGGVTTQTAEGALTGSILGGITAYSYDARQANHGPLRIGYIECNRRFNTQAEIEACYRGVRDGEQRALRNRIRNANRTGYNIGYRTH